MDYISCHVTDIIPVTDDIFILKLHSDVPYRFQAGQYCELALETGPSLAPHLFSLASNPRWVQNLEFCIRTFGDFTRSIVHLPMKSTLYASSPMGSFTLKHMSRPYIFLAGGMGIAPIISMLRYLLDEEVQLPIMVLVGNRTRASVLYLTELAAMQQKHTHIRIIHVLSDEKSTPNFVAYEGFITKDILSHEVDFSGDPIFYINGPPVFVDKMQQYVQECGVAPHSIIIEKPAQQHYLP